MPSTQPPIDPFIAPICHAQIEILYQDEHLLLIHKPSGLLTLSGKNPLNQDSVHFRLKQDFPTAMMVHRLDFGTSGIMVVALNKAINSHIGKQFQIAHIAKMYTAILYGHLQENSGEINAPIAKGEFPLQKICHIHGKSALSRYRVLQRARLNQPAESAYLLSSQVLSTRVEFYPQTGRTHQLRIHSQHIGHPILGCDLYGNETTRLSAKRLMLHATRLEFDHPISGERVFGFCPCPF